MHTSYEHRIALRFDLEPRPAPVIAPNKGTLTPQAQGCQAKIQGAVNNALNTNSTFLGPTAGPGMNSMGYRNALTTSTTLHLVL
jgi:hypothetical protein